MGGSKKVTVGYWYSMGLHMGICHGPVDALLEIRVADRTLWSGSVTANTTLNIDQLDLFGGEAKEGGIKGTLDVMMGSSIQGANSYLTLHQGATQPAYRGILGFVFRGRIAANNPYIKPWAARVKRILADWDGGTVWNSGEAEIGVAVGVVAMNPAHIIYQALTDRRRGKGLSPSRLDIDSFEEASATFYSEGLGFCFNWNKPGPIENFVQQVCDHAGAAVGEDPRTGKIRLKAIRHDYDIEDLPVFSREEGNIIEVEAFERAAATGTVNEITVRYADQTLAGETGSVTVQHLASIQAQGMVTATTRDYVGAPTGEIAARLAMRDLQASTAGLARVRLRCTRAAYGILPGDVIAFSEPRYGVALMPLRVGHVDYGTLTRGEITIEAVQDVFGMPNTTYLGTQGPIWTEPPAGPAPPAPVEAMEAPYRDLVQEIGSVQAEALDPDAGFLMAMAGRPDGPGINYQLETRVAPNDYDEAGPGEWCPHGTIVAPPLSDGFITPSDDTIVVTGVDLDQVRAGTAARIGTSRENEEIVRIEEVISSGTFRIARGCSDTTPKPHEDGTPIWFYEDFAASDSTEYATGEEVDAMFRTVSGMGILSRDDSPVDTVVMDKRQNRPYPPGRLRFDNYETPGGEFAYPEVIITPNPTFPVRVTWAHRDRLLQKDQLIDESEGDIGPEDGVTYTVRYYNAENDTLLDERSEIEGTSDEFEASTLTPMRVEVWSVRDGLESWQPAQHVLNFSPPEQGPGPGGPDPDVVVFTESGTWTKPEGLDYIEVTLVGGGGGGAGGARLTLSGGPINQDIPIGGGGGARVKVRIPAAQLPPVVDVQVGVGGAGGPSWSSGSTNTSANVGKSGMPSRFWVASNSGVYHISAGGGNATTFGVWGGTSSGGSVSVKWPSGYTILETSYGGRASGWKYAAENPPLAYPDSGLWLESPGAAGAGAPGGLPSSFEGVPSVMPWRDGGYGSGGVVPGGWSATTDGGDGFDGGAGSVDGSTCGGGGGGGGPASPGVAGGKGGNGGYPGGGGGGGGTAIIAHGVASGAGGDGADGVVVIKHFYLS